MVMMELKKDDRVIVLKSFIKDADIERNDIQQQRHSTVHKMFQERIIRHTFERRKKNEIGLL